MHRRLSPGVVLVRLALLALLSLAISCGGVTPQAQAPMRELPKSSAALLAMAPQTYGGTAPIDFGADDAGSKAAQAAFEKVAGGALVHEPALDLVAAVLGRAYFEAPGASPASSLIQWIYWKCGSVSLPGTANVLVAEAGLEQAYDQHLIDTLARLPKGSAMQMTYGLARLSVPGGSLQAIAVGFRAMDLAPLPKKYAPGATLTIAGGLRAGFGQTMAYMESDGPEPAEIALPPSGDRVGATVQLPSKPGRYFLQIRGAEPPRSAGAEPWHRNLFWAPVYVGMDEPAAPDELIRHPPKNHPDRSAWLFQVLQAYNEVRASLGRPPLAFVREASMLAQAKSDERAALTTDPPPDPALTQRLADVGLPPRDLVNSAGWLEYVSEYIYMRLLQPWNRHRIVKENVSVLALGLAQRPGSVGSDFLVTEYLFEPVKIDPAKDGARLLGQIEALEGKAGRKAPERDEKLSEDAQRLAAAVCAGGPISGSGEEIWSKVKARAPDLHHRMASSAVGYDVTNEDIAAIARPLSEAVTYTRMGIGVCQGKVDGHANAAFTLLLLMGP